MKKMYNPKDFPGWVYAVCIISIIVIMIFSFVGDQITSPEHGSGDYSKLGDFKEYTSGANRIFIANDIAYVVDYRDGLEIFNVSDPANPIELGQINIGDNIAKDVIVSDEIAYIAYDNGGLRVVNVSDPTNPIAISYVNTGGEANGIFISNNIAYVADGNNGLVIININDPQHPFIISTHELSGAIDVYVSGGKAYVIYDNYDDDYNLIIINVYNPSSTFWDWKYTPGSSGSGLEEIIVRGDVVYIADGRNGVRVINVSEAPQLINDIGEDAEGIDLHGELLFIATGDDSITIYNVSSVLSPIFMMEISTLSNTKSVFYTKGVIYVSESYDAIEVFDIEIDMDGDDLTDYLENYHYNTDALNPDSDGDGIFDGWEVSNALNPLNSIDSMYDYDGDEVQNLYEFYNGTDPKDSDSDNDGLGDFFEITNGLNPMDPDTDGDSFGDIRDPNPLSFFMPMGLILVLIFGAIFAFGLFIFIGLRVKKKKLEDEEEKIRKERLEYQRKVQEKRRLDQIEEEKRRKIRHEREKKESERHERERKIKIQQERVEFEKQELQRRKYRQKVREDAQNKAAEYKNLGDRMLKAGNYILSIESYQKAISIYTTISDHNEVRSINAKISEIKSIINQIEVDRRRFEHESFQKEKEREIKEKIRKMMSVSKRIRLDAMIITLKMEEDLFYDNIWDWAVQFNFKIDGDYILIENTDISGFIENLDKQFELWRSGKKDKDK